MLQRTLPAGFIAPCLPTKTDKLPSGSQWLHEIKHDGFQSPGIRFNEHIEGDGPTVFAHACKLGLEGIVSKRKDSTDNASAILGIARVTKVGLRRNCTNPKAVFEPCMCFNRRQGSL